MTNETIKYKEISMTTPPSEKYPTVADVTADMSDKDIEDLYHPYTDSDGSDLGPFEMLRTSPNKDRIGEIRFADGRAAWKRN